MSFGNNTAADRRMREEIDIKDIIAIDLGTSSLAAAVFDGGHPAILTTSQGDASISLFEETQGQNTRPLSGAREADASYATAVKRLGQPSDGFLGQDSARPQAGVDGQRTSMPGSGRLRGPERIMATILRRLKEEAESYMGRRFSRAVLTVPAHFDGEQRQAAERATNGAGLTVLHVMDAPVAAALALEHDHRKPETLLVVDLDRGHLDVAVLTLAEDRAMVLARDGDPALGHEAWADSIADRLAEAFLRRHGIDIRRDSRAVLRLRIAAGEAGMRLSQAGEAPIDLPFIASGAHGPLHLHTVLTRQTYAAQTTALRAQLSTLIENTLRHAGIEGAQADHVLLLGKGAGGFALQATIRRLAGGIPVTNDRNREMAALGAALYAARAGTTFHRFTSSNATRLGLGLETVGGLMTTMIPRGTPLPARRTEIFSTSEDDQTTLEITVLQGERPLATDNRKLGVVRLDGIPPASRGTPQIEVAFKISIEGQIEVTARDLASGASQTLSTAMDEVVSDQEAQRVVAEALSHEADDLRRRAQVEAENLGRQTIYQTSRYLQHLNGVSNRAECRQARREVEEKLGALREAVEAKDLQRIRRLTEDIQTISNALSHLAYGREAIAVGEQGVVGRNGGHHRQARITIEKL